MFAQTVTGPEPIIGIAQYGILGLVVVGFIIGWIWPRPAVERLLKERDAEAAATQRQLMRESAIVQEKLNELNVKLEALREDVAGLEALLNRPTRLRRDVP